MGTKQIMSKISICQTKPTKPTYTDNYCISECIIITGCSNFGPCSHTKRTFSAPVLVIAKKPRLKPKWLLRVGFDYSCTTTNEEIAGVIKIILE